MTTTLSSYNGAMSVLQPYIDKGKLIVQSKQVGMNKASTLRWDGAVAQARMDNLLSAFYGKAKVNAILSPYDGLSIGIFTRNWPWCPCCPSPKTFFSAMNHPALA